MAVDKYFTLTNSSVSLSKKFQVVLSGHKITLEKSQTIDKTLEGGLDVSMGGLYERYEYLVRVRHEEERAGYGTLADLKTFFSYNNPNGSPSNVLTLVTHIGQEYSVFMVGSFSEQLLGVMVEGVNAWSLVQCTFMINAAVSS